MLLMNTPSRRHQAGAVNGTLLAVIFLVIAVIALGSLSVWLYVGYQKATTNIEGQKKLAAASARKTQADEDAATYAEKEKQPFRLFVGPDDYGHLTFDYPKTWSVYVAQEPNGDGGDFAAYLNPRVVPPVDTENQRFATRVTIQSQSYDDTIASFQDQVQAGELHSKPVSVNGHDGARLDGKFSEDIRGAAVIFKIRDKTAVIATDADTFLSDFNKIIKTIKFNQ